MTQQPRQGAENVGNKGNPEAEANGDRDDERGPAIHANPSQNPDAGDGYCAKHYDGCASKDRLRKRLDKATHHGEQAKRHQDHRNESAHVAATDPGQLDDSIILGEGRARKRVENGSEQGIDAVRQDARAQPPEVEVSGDRLVRQR